MSMSKSMTFGSGPQREARPQPRTLGHAMTFRPLWLVLTGMALWWATAPVQATVTMEPWTLLFKGIEHSTGNMTPGGGDGQRLVVHALRVNLRDPDIQLFTTPLLPNRDERSGITGAQTVSDFLQVNQLQVAVNANFYEPSEVNFPGTPVTVIGSHISEGLVVAYPQSREAAATFHFTTNKEVIFLPTNFPPVSTSGIYTSISGHYPLVMDGVSVADNFRSPINGNNPRTAIGITEDGNHLLLVTIDGRQPGYSDGCEDEETAAWMLRYGAFNAINVDGGGSTTMVMADCLGLPVRLNQPSYLQGRGRERYIGSHLGVYSRGTQGFINQVKVTPGRTTAILRWTTLSNATTQLEYGPTAAYGSITPLDPVLTQTHEVRLTNLDPGSTTYFRILANADGQEYSTASCFETTNVVQRVFDFNQRWKYQTNVLDGLPWMATTYSDADWLGEGPGLLYVEDNQQVTVKRTRLPAMTAAGNSRVATTFYFRTHFNFTNAALPLSLVFSNYLDDGAIFYLNGKEIQRLRMPTDTSVPILWTTLANGSNPTDGTCNGDAQTNCPIVFSLTGDALTNLVRGDNLVAVEVHNFSVGSPDVVFGTALFYELGYEPGEEGTAPSFTQQPASSTVVVGQAATISTTVEGTAPITYSWFFNQAPLPAFTGPSLTIDPVAFANGGDYQLIARNAHGSATSTVARLTVVAPPALTIRQEEQKIIVSWPGTGFTLQQAAELGGSPGIQWITAPGAASSSPYVTTNSDRSRYFRLLR